MAVARPRILLLIKTLGIGGAEHLLVSAARHMDHSSFDYRVVFLAQAPSERADTIRATGLPVEGIGSIPGIGWAPALRRMLTNGRVDLVHVHSPLPAAAARLLRRPTTPIVYTEHSVWSNHHPLTRLANRMTYGRNAHVFAVSERVRESILSHRTAAAPVVETLHHGIDLVETEAWERSPADLAGEFSIPDGAPVVVSVGNLRPAKGQRVLLEAAVEVRRQVPGVRFLVVGGGAMGPQLRRHAEQLGLAEAVTFTGFRQDAVRLAAGADVFALPSIRDGLSIALIEAMALGKGIAMTAAGGNVEAVKDQREGLVVPPGQPAALARAMVTLLADVELRSRLGEAARRRARAFDIRHAVKRQEEVYRELLVGASSGR
jgi:glycosyltransferase involved in cell wall biosynthesis